MWVFWIVTSLLSAAAAALVIARARGAARIAQDAPQDPALPVYRRQLAELEEQAEQGLLGPGEHRAARAEAGRRLLRFTDAAARPEASGGRASRLTAAICAGLAASLALGTYLVLGAPGLPDQPYAGRLAAWRGSDPATLDPARMAAVLRDIARQRPHDARAYEYLGRAELAVGDSFKASRDFATAAALAPGRADLRAAEGQALILDGQGKLTPEAAVVFQQALKIDPHNAAARYYVGRAQVAGGDVAGGLAHWRALLADIAPGDPHRPALQAEIDKVETLGAVSLSQPTAPPPSASPNVAPPPMVGPAPAFIRAMVARQAAELKASPDNPAGWARLVRSYGVLGDTAEQRSALAQARRLFANRPTDLAAIEAQALRGPPRSGGPGLTAP